MQTYNTIIEFVRPVLTELVRLIRNAFKQNNNTDKHLSDSVPTQNGLKEADSFFFLLLLNFSFEHAIRIKKVRINYNSMGLVIFLSWLVILIILDENIGSTMKKIQIFHYATILLEKIMVASLVTAFFGTPTFMTAFATVRH
jgi:hypothetical protein